MFRAFRKREISEQLNTLKRIHRHNAQSDERFLFLKNVKNIVEYVQLSFISLDVITLDETKNGLKQKNFNAILYVPLEIQSRCVCVSTFLYISKLKRNFSFVCQKTASYPPGAKRLEYQY